jgi:DUF971 family protein
MSERPDEIRLKEKGRRLELNYASGERLSLVAEYLRVESPSAEVQGHGPGEGILVAGKRDVAISRLEPVGNYAIRIIFDDGHSTGLYTWTYLADLARDEERIWGGYLKKLEAAKLAR